MHLGRGLKVTDRLLADVDHLLVDTDRLLADVGRLLADVGRLLADTKAGASEDLAADLDEPLVITVTIRQFLMYTD